MGRLKLIIGVLVIFGAGVLAGSFGMGIYLKRRIEVLSAGGPPPPERKALLIRRLSRELDLTEAQRMEVGKIIEETEARLFAIRREFLPQIREVMEEGFSRMKEKLTPRQQEKLERIRDRLRRRNARAFLHSILPPGRPEWQLSRMKERLRLSEEQERRIRPILVESFRKQREIVRRYRERFPLRIRRLRKEMMRVKESLWGRLSSILTEEQMREYTRMQQESQLEMGPPWGGRPPSGPPPARSPSSPVPEAPVSAR